MPSALRPSVPRPREPGSAGVLPGSFLKNGPEDGSYGVSGHFLSLSSEATSPSSRCRQGPAPLHGAEAGASSVPVASGGGGRPGVLGLWRQPPPGPPAASCCLCPSPCKDTVRTQCGLLTAHEARRQRPDPRASSRLQARLGPALPRGPRAWTRSEDRGHFIPQRKPGSGEEDWPGRQSCAWQPLCLVTPGLGAARLGVPSPAPQNRKGRKGGQTDRQEANETREAGHKSTVSTPGLSASSTS